MEEVVRLELEAQRKEVRFLAMLVGEMLAILADAHRPAADLFEARLAVYTGMDPSAADIMSAVQAGKDHVQSALRSVEARHRPRDV